MEEWINKGLIISVSRPTPSVFPFLSMSAPLSLNRYLPSSRLFQLPSERDTVASCLVVGRNAAFKKAIVDMLKQNKRMSLAALGGKVTKPKEIPGKLKQFLSQDDTFKIVGDQVQLA